MGKRPVLNYTPNQNQPIVKAIEDKKWTFSFRFWKQIEFFGLDQSTPQWFISLLEKLTDLSNKKISDFLSDGAEKNAWRYHQIDWNQKNIPIQREDLTWLESDYRDNEAEYPLVQFQVSKALGRVVGFWDENQVFNIILLDPLHNIQPAKSHSYKVDSCSPLNCEYTSLVYNLKVIKETASCFNQACEYKARIHTLPSNSNYTNVLMHYIDDDLQNKISNMIESGEIKSHTELLEYGIISIEDKTQ